MYDPLIDPSPGCGEPYPQSYWQSTLTNVSSHDSLQSDIDSEVVVIGGGYTGLSCALHLAREHGMQTTLVEANKIGWGCSGRNAGFILGSSGRKTITSMVNSWGDATMQAVYREYAQGVETVNALISEGIDCEAQSPGYLKMAHKPSMVKVLHQQADLLESTFDKQIERLTRQQIHRDYVADHASFGAIKFNDGYGINPLKLALGYRDLAVNAGVAFYESTPVEHWQPLPSGKHLLKTPQGQITANKVVIATNGYTPKNLFPVVKNKTLPVLSQIIVTSALSEQDVIAAGFQTSAVVMDTRALKYYYRKLPDNRILFGGRGAITGKSADDPYYAERLLSVLKQSFPMLSGLSIDYAWSGWICMSLDDIPHVRCADNNHSVFYGMGYCGSGVSYSVQAGKRMAQMVAGQNVPELPMYQTDLPTFPLAPLRRLGQWGYFQYGKIKDEWF